MTLKRDELGQLDKEQLIEYVFALHGRLLTLEQQVRDLQALVSAKDKVKKTPKNSSIPSGQSRKANQPQALAKRGGKDGHAGHGRARVEPDEVVECRVGVCSGCGHDLSGMRQRVVGQRQVVDIPPAASMVRETRCYSAKCPQCGLSQRGVYPAGFERGRVVGAGLSNLVVYLHHAHPLSYQRVQRVLRDMYGVSLSQSALVNVVQRCRAAAAQAAGHIQQQVRQQAVLGSDETGVRVQGHNHWQWVFQSPQWVYMHIHPQHSQTVIHDVMGNAHPQVWVSDLGPAQLHHPAQHLQVCLAHQVRELQFVIDTAQCPWATNVQATFYQAIQLGQQRTTLTPATYTKRVRQLEQHLEAVLATYPTSADAQRLWRRFRKHRPSLLTFLYHPNAPPTNNASEQALRNSVIYRKVTGGFRSAWGADLYANLISIFETARRQGRDLFATLADVVALHPIFAPIPE